MPINTARRTQSRVPLQRRIPIDRRPQAGIRKLGIPRRFVQSQTQCKTPNQQPPQPQDSLKQGHKIPLKLRRRLCRSRPGKIPLVYLDEPPHFLGNLLDIPRRRQRRVVARIIPPGETLPSIDPFEGVNPLTPGRFPPVVVFRVQSAVSRLFSLDGLAEEAERRLVCGGCDR